MIQQRENIQRVQCSGANCLVDVIPTRHFLNVAEFTILKWPPQSPDKTMYVKHVAFNTCNKCKRCFYMMFFFWLLPLGITTVDHLSPSHSVPSILLYLTNPLHVLCILFTTIKESLFITFVVIYYYFIFMIYLWCFRVWSPSISGHLYMLLMQNITCTFSLLCHVCLKHVQAIKGPCDTQFMGPKDHKNGYKVYKVYQM